MLGARANNFLVSTILLMSTVRMSRMAMRMAMRTMRDDKDRDANEDEEDGGGNSEDS